MTVFAHTFCTWLVANLLHPFVWLIISLSGLLPYDLFFDRDPAQVVGDILVVSMIFSFPCLLMGVICLRLVIHAPYTVEARLGIWIVTASLLIILEFLALFAWVDWIKMYRIAGTLPAIAATVSAIAIRYRPFKRLLLSTTGNEEIPAHPQTPLT